MPDALPAAALPVYRGLGQAPNMLVCIPSGLVVVIIPNPNTAEYQTYHAE